MLATAANFPGRERVGTILILLPISPQNLDPYLATRGTLVDDSPRGLGGGFQRTVRFMQAFCTQGGWGEVGGGTQFCIHRRPLQASVPRPGGEGRDDDISDL